MKKKFCKECEQEVKNEDIEPLIMGYVIMIDKSSNDVHRFRYVYNATNWCNNIQTARVFRSENSVNEYLESSEFFKTRVDSTGVRKPSKPIMDALGMGSNETEVKFCELHIVSLLTGESVKKTLICARVEPPIGYRYASEE